MKKPRGKLAHLKAKWEELLTLAKKPNDQGIHQFLLDLLKKIGVQSFDLFTTQVLAWGRHDSNGHVREEKAGKEGEAKELFSIVLSSYNKSRLIDLFTNEVWRDFYRFYKPIMEEETEELYLPVVAFVYKQFENAPKIAAEKAEKNAPS